MRDRDLPGWEGRGAEEWKRRLGLPRLELHPSLPSTNDRLREMAEEGAPPFTTVVADVQTRGRGRGGKRWRSEGGSGLWISVLLPPPPTGTPGVITLAVGVAAAEAVEVAAGVGCRLKWPNDLLLGGEVRPGGKVGGILCERLGEMDWVLAGVGINLRRVAVPLAGSVNLEETSGVIVPPHRMASLLLERLRIWADPPPGRVGPDLRQAWDTRDVLAGRMVQVETGVRGRAAGLAGDGALLVDCGSGALTAIRGGSVRLLDEKQAPYRGSESVREGSGKP